MNRLTLFDVNAGDRLWVALADGQCVTATGAIYCWGHTSGGARRRYGLEG